MTDVKVSSAIRSSLFDGRVVRVVYTRVKILSEPVTDVSSQRPDSMASR